MGCRCHHHRHLLYFHPHLHSPLHSLALQNARLVILVNQWNVAEPRRVVAFLEARKRAALPKVESEERGAKGKKGGGGGKKKK